MYYIYNINNLIITIYISTYLGGGWSPRCSRSSCTSTCPPSWGRRWRPTPAIGPTPTPASPMSSSQRRSGQSPLCTFSGAVLITILGTLILGPSPCWKTPSRGLLFVFVWRGPSVEALPTTRDTDPMNERYWKALPGARHIQNVDTLISNDWIDITSIEVHPLYEGYCNYHHVWVSSQHNYHHEKNTCSSKCKNSACANNKYIYKMTAFLST